MQFIRVLAPDCVLAPERVLAQDCVLALERVHAPKRVLAPERALAQEHVPLLKMTTCRYSEVSGMSGLSLSSIDNCFTKEGSRRSEFLKHPSDH